MNIKRAKQEITNTVRAYLSRDAQGFYRIPQIRQRPILLMGPPGIGKTQVMEQIAGECDLALVSYTITHHTRQSAIGLPYIVKRKYGGREKSVTEYTMSEIIASVYERMEASGKKEGILFIDEINCVSETLAPAMLQFLQGKTFGNQKVPDGWIIVAAGNPAEYNRSVREFDVVTLDRLRVMNIEADYGVWREYASEQMVHGSILSYLDIHRENFYRMETTVDGREFVTARGWEDLSDLLKTYESLGIECDYPQITQFVRDSATAAEFAAFYDMYKRYENAYMLDDILKGQADLAVRERFKSAGLDEKIGVIGLISAKLNSEFNEFARKRAVADRLFSMVKKAGDANVKTTFADEVRVLKDELSRGRATGLLSDERSVVLNSAAETAGGWIQEDIEGLRDKFFEFNEAVESDADGIRSMLDNIYDFLEDTKTDGTELVLFTTELSSGSRSLEFIRDEGYERFFGYNRELLGG